MDSSIKRIKKFNDALSDILNELTRSEHTCETCLHWKKHSPFGDYGKCEMISGSEGMMFAEIMLMESYDIPSSKKELFLETRNDFYCKLFEELK